MSGARGVSTSARSMPALTGVGVPQHVHELERVGHHLGQTLVARHTGHAPHVERG
ncbi:MAG: hypothetical protein R2854_18010 [Caldilineaceae bacterium]